MFSSGYFLSRKQAIYLFLFWCLLTIAIRPFRVFLTQDDALYAGQALMFAQGVFKNHPDTMAAVLPQSLIGSWLIQIFQNSNPIILLNGLTWFVFLFLFLAVRRVFDLKAVTTVGILSSPFWLQYASGYLYDNYAVLFIVMTIGSWSAVSRATGRTAFLMRMILAVFTFLSAAQLQSLYAPILFMVIISLVERKWIEVSVMLISSVAAWLSLKFIEPGFFQLAHLENLAHGQNTILVSFFAGIQMVLGLGFLLIPTFPIRRLKEAKVLALLVVLNFVAAVFLYLQPTKILAAGVFFSDYLPRFAAVFLVSVGVWGWVSVVPTLRKMNTHTILFVGLIIGTCLLFGYRGVSDFRYSMILVPVILWWLNRSDSSLFQGIVGSRLWFVVPAWVLSIFLNSYSVETTVARWELAQHLKSDGAQFGEVSAGYGHDAFFLESACIGRAYQKLGSPGFLDNQFRARIYSRLPRVYEDEWIPKYLVKPSMLFGKRLSLNFNRAVGQDQEPFKTLNYKQLGFIPNSLAVYRNLEPKRSWCFQ